MDQTDQERSIQELRVKYPEGQRSALMDDFLDAVDLSTEDKILPKKFEKIGSCRRDDCKEIFSPFCGILTGTGGGKKR